MKKKKINCAIYLVNLLELRTVGDKDSIPQVFHYSGNLYVETICRPMPFLVNALLLLCCVLIN